LAHTAVPRSAALCTTSDEPRAMTQPTSSWPADRTGASIKEKQEWPENRAWLPRVWSSLWPAPVLGDSNATGQMGRILLCLLVLTLAVASGADGVCSACVLHACTSISDRARVARRRRGSHGRVHVVGTLLVAQMT
jgi:hypothetical protein